MPTTNARIRKLAERALTLSNNDIARTARVLSELTGLSFELAFEAVEEVAATNKIKLALREPAVAAE
jgi:hypothetical protein